jgi:hypothetical protein
VGVHVSGMRVPALDDDHGIPGVRRGFIEFRDYSNVIGRMKMKDDMICGIRTLEGSRSVHNGVTIGFGLHIRRFGDRTGLMGL